MPEKGCHAVQHAHLLAVVGIREDPGQTLIHSVQDLGWPLNQPCLTATKR